MSCGVGHRPGLDPILLWLAAASPIQVWETAYTMGVDLKRKKKKDRKKEKEKKKK